MAIRVAFCDQFFRDLLCSLLFYVPLVLLSVSGLWLVDD